MDEIDEIEKLKRKLALDVDARYGLASSDHLMSDKEHFDVWDKMMEIEMRLFHARYYTTCEV